MIRVPERRPDPAGSSTTPDNGRGRQVGRVSLEHVGPFAEDTLPNLVEAPQQVIGAVVRQGGTGEPKKARGYTARRHAFAERSIFIARPGGHHQVLVPKLAQKVTSNGQMASNPTASLGIELRDINDLQ